MTRRFLCSFAARPAPGFLLLAALCLCAACAAMAVRLAPGEARPGFPLVEEGTLELPRGVNFPIREHAGSLLFTTREGVLYSVDVSYRQVVWTFRAGAGVAVPPAVGDEAVGVLDQDGTLYRIGYTGELLQKISLPATPSTPVRENQGRLYFGTAGGEVVVLELAAGGKSAWEFDAQSPVRAGPVFWQGRVIFGLDDGRLIALDAAGKASWVFRAKGAVTTDPAVAYDCVYAGTTEGFYYGLDAKTGAKKWTFRLGGAPLFPPLSPAKGFVLFTTSNSVVYCLSAKGGEIRWWQAVPSRVVHAPLYAGGTVLAAAHSPNLAAYELATGKPAGEYHSAGELEMGAIWVAPRLVLVETTPDSGAFTLRFLTREIVLAVASDLASPVTAGTDVEFKAVATGFEAPLLFEFYLVADGHRTLVRGASPKSAWTWRAPAEGRFTVVVRAFDRFRTRQAEASMTVEKRPGKS